MAIYALGGPILRGSSLQEARVRFHVSKPHGQPAAQSPALLSCSNGGLLDFEVIIKSYTTLDHNTKTSFAHQRGFWGCAVALPDAGPCTHT